MDQENQDWITDFIVFALTWPTPETWDSEMRSDFKGRIGNWLKTEIEEAYPIADVVIIDPPEL